MKAKKSSFRKEKRGGAFSFVSRFLIGDRAYEILPDAADRAANLLFFSGGVLNLCKRLSDGSLYLRVPTYDAAKIECLLEKNGIAFSRIGERGLPSLIKRYRHRFGIPAGIGIFLIMLFLAGRFLWSFEVVGNKQISDKEILSTLEELGCSVGTPIGSLDLDRLHEDFLLKRKDIAWIAVNIRGTHARVEVKETDFPPLTLDEASPFNVVATENGTIVSAEILRGSAEVKNGDFVVAGQILGSGVVKTAEGWELVHARGKVLAEVERQIHVEVPLSASRKVTKKEICLGKTLKFFGFSVKLFGNSGNSPADYDKIERETPIVLFGRIPLPITLSETLSPSYETVTVELTEKEARSEAYRELRAACEEASRDGVLVGREITETLTDGKYSLTCRLTLITDIAKEVPIYR